MRLMPLKDPEKAREYGRLNYIQNKYRWKNPDGTWRVQDPEARRRARRAYYNSHPEFRAKHQRKQKERKAKTRVYGDCPICGVRSPASGPFSEGQLVRDHDHITGLDRGWICRHCNLALGHANNSPETLRRMACYLEGKMTGLMGVAA